ncbi:MAG: (Fe-S)-binding protein [Bacillota bacterium]
MNESRRARLQEELARCMRCGFCQAACPVYRERGTEFSVARGKLILIEAVLDGRIGLTRDVRDALEACLLCKSCRAACPSGVRTDVILAAARELAAERYGHGLLKTAAFAALKRPALLAAAAGAGAHLWGLAFAPEDGGDLWRLRLPPGNLYPRLPRRSLLSRLGAGELGATAAAGGRAMKVSPDTVRGTVILFPGCLVNFMLPQVGLAAIKVLLSMGSEVIVPSGQACCGTPLYVNGDRAGAGRLAETNLSWLASAGVAASGGGPPVVFVCPSCAESWRGYPEMVREEWTALARQVADRVTDISVFLTRRGPEEFLAGLVAAAGRPGRGDAGPRVTVTYHDPCHLAQAQGVRVEPRALLRSLPGVALKEMAEPGGCCGSGGTFGLFHHDLSGRIGGRKAADITATEAVAVATGCPACLLQLRQELSAAGRSAVGVRHTVELLAEVVDAGRK